MEKAEFRYVAISAGDGTERILTRDELVAALEWNVVDVDVAIAVLEQTPGEQYRMTDFSFFRADRKG